MNYYNTLLAKKTGVIRFDSLYEQLFETWINRARQILKDLPAGAISTVSDAEPLPLNALSVSVEAWQDLHGYDYPWVGGAGKNKFGGEYGVANKYPIPSAATQMTFSAKSDGLYKLSVRTYNSADVKVGSDYTIIDIGSTANYVTVTLPNDATQFILFISGGGTAANFGDVQAEVGSSATSYAPYENICPISGWSTATIIDKDDLTTPTQTETYTHAFTDSQGNPFECFGGEWNVVDGGLDSDYVMLTVDGSETFTLRPKSGVNPRRFTIDISSVGALSLPDTGNTSSAFIYQKTATLDDAFGIFRNSDTLLVFPDADNRFANETEIKAWFTSNPTQFLLQATPITIPQQAESIRMLEGVNNIYADCGEMLSGKYWAKG